ncbi:MAG: response regulator, partial [Cytophagales bacterium]|nr:response regulator [Cytophagales bacterium]
MKQSQSPAKVLAVDDDECVLDLLKTYTTNAGWRCSTASSAAAAYKALADQNFDLLLTEIKMPGESGIDLIQFVQKAFPNLAVVVVSGIKDPKEARTIMQLGVYGFIVKPFEKSQVQITINNAIIRKELEKKTQNRNRELEIAVRQRTSQFAQLVEDLTAAKAKISDTAKFHKDQSLFMQTLLDAIPSSIYYKDSEGKYLGCNQAFESFFGLDRTKIIGKSSHEILPAECSLHHLDEESQVFSGPGVHTYDGITLHCDGSMRNVIVNKAAFHNASDEIAGLVGVMVDVTDFKEKEKELLLLEEKNRNVFENIGIGIAIISPSMEVMEMNGKMQQWFPSAKADGESLCFRSFLNPERDDVCGPCPTKLTLKDGEVHESIVQHRNGDQVRDFRIVSSAIKDRNGKIVSAIELLNDITEDLVMERELLQAQKLASIGQLAAGVAHEINN